MAEQEAMKKSHCIHESWPCMCCHMMWLGATYPAGTQTDLSESWVSRQRAFQSWMVDVVRKRLDFPLGPSPSAPKVQASWIFSPGLDCPSLQVPHLPPIPEPTVGEDHSEIGQDTNVYTGTPAQKKAQVPVI